MPQKKREGTKPSLYPDPISIVVLLERAKIGVLLEDLSDRGGELGTDEQTNYLPDYRNRLHYAFHLTIS
jgi:hypothetical protein